MKLPRFHEKIRCEYTNIITADPAPGPVAPGTIVRRIATSVVATAEADTRLAYSLGGGEGAARGLLSMMVCMKGR